MTNDEIRTTKEFRKPNDEGKAMNDLKFAFRQLLKNPGFAAAAALTLALGIGASVAIFSVVNIVILNPIPGTQPDRLIQIGERSHGNMDEPMFGGLTTAAIEILKTKQEFFSDVVWMDDLYLERKTEDFIEGRKAEAEGRSPKYQGK